MSNEAFAIADDNTSSVTVNVNPRTAAFNISVVAVDANDDYEEVTGTADLQVMINGTGVFENVYEADGTTPRSFDVSELLKSVSLSDIKAVAFRSTPTSLAADKRLKMIVNNVSSKKLI